MNNESESISTGYLDTAVMDSIRYTLQRTSCAENIDVIHYMLSEISKLSTYGFFTDQSVTAIVNLIFGKTADGFSNQEIYLDFLQEFLYTLNARGVTLDTISYLTSIGIGYDSISRVVEEQLGQFVSVDDNMRKDALVQCLYLFRINIVFALNTLKSIVSDTVKSKEKEQSWQIQNIRTL